MRRVRGRPAVAHPGTYYRADARADPIGSLNFSAVGCNGGLVLGWSPSDDERFNHYTVLRNTVANIPLGHLPRPVAPLRRASSR